MYTGSEISVLQVHFQILFAAVPQPVVDIGPLFLIAAAAFAAITCGFAMQRTLRLLLSQPVKARDRRLLLWPYIGLFFAASIGIGSVPLIVSVPGLFTYPLAFSLGAAIAAAIWLQFIAKVLTLPPERFLR